MGVLPEAAGDFGVSIPTAGWLVSGYALGVVFGAPLLTVLGTKVSRKKMLMFLMGLFVVGNALSASAPTFGVMLAGRVVASLAHGAFFGIGSVVAAGLASPEKKALATRPASAPPSPPPASPAKTCSSPPQRAVAAHRDDAAALYRAH